MTDPTNPINPMSALTLAERLAAVRRRKDDAARAAGRDPSEIRLLPVSKTQPASVLAVAAEAGVVRFGENRVQEVVAKDAKLRAMGLAPEWAVIGPLQSNKVKHVAELASEFQALESLHIAEALQRRLEALGRQLDVFIEVNTSDEAAKHGVAVDAALDFAASLAPYDALVVRGLMTVAAYSSDHAVVATCFDRLATLRDRLRDAGTLGVSWDELSMGMSGDFELAIAHGATVVRVGTAIFGPRRGSGFPN